MPHEEKPPSRTQRIAWIAWLIAMWLIFVGPMVVLFLFWSGWWGLIPLALALWASYDFLKSGGLFEQIDSKDVAIGDKDWRIRRLF